jgi:hypothetical protein
MIGNNLFPCGFNGSPFVARTTDARKRNAIIVGSLCIVEAGFPDHELPIFRDITGGRQTRQRVASRRSEFPTITPYTPIPRCAGCPTHSRSLANVWACRPHPQSGQSRLRSVEICPSLQIGQKTCAIFLGILCQEVEPINARNPRRIKRVRETADSLSKPHRFHLSTYVSIFYNKSCRLKDLAANSR